MKRRPAVLIAAALASALAGAVLLELGCYAYLRYFCTSAVKTYLGSMVDHFHPLFHLEGGTPDFAYYPYVGLYGPGRWAGRPPVKETPDGWVLLLSQIDEPTTPYATLDKPKDTLRIVALGGSTLAGYGLAHSSETITAQLEAGLRRAHPDKRIEVLNSAVPGHIAAEELVLLATKVMLFKPDLILIVDGHNDFVRAYHFPAMPPLWSQYQEHIYRTYARSQSFSTTLGQLAYLLSKRFYCLAIPRAMLYHRRTSVSASRPAAAWTLSPSAYDRAVDEYLHALQSIVGVAREHRVPILVAQQPTLAQRKSPNATERRLLEDWDKTYPHIVESARYFWTTLGARRGPWAKERERPGVRALNLSGAFSSHPETLYLDDCHYNATGARLVGEALRPAAESLLGLK